MSEPILKPDGQDFLLYKAAVEAKPRKPLEELARYVTYIKSFKKDDVKQVVPVFLAAIKKNPDDALYALAHFLSHGKFDSSPYLPEFFGVLKDHLQSKNDELSRDSLLSFHRLVRGARDPIVLLQVAGDVLKMPSGSLPAARRVWADALCELGKNVRSVRWLAYG